MVKPGICLIWYNGNPNLAKWMQEYTTAWVQVARKTDKGKPENVIPGGVVFATEELGGPSSKTWYGALGPHSYDWTDGVWPLEEMYAHLVASYLLFVDKRYLEPVETLFALNFNTKTYTGGGDLKDIAFVAKLAKHFDSVVQFYRVMTKREKFDQYIQGFSRIYGGYPSFLITGDKRYIISSAEKLHKLVKDNIYRWTEHPIMRQTDKAKRAYDVFRFLACVYLGGSGLTRARYPGMAVSWEGTGYDFAALIMDSRRDYLKVLVYNFEERAKIIGLRLWQIERGIYKVKIGSDKDEDDVMDSISKSYRMEIVERGQTIPVELPSRILQVIEINQSSSSGIRWTDLTDVTISSEDVMLEPPNPKGGDIVQAKIKVHNISSKEAKDVQIGIFSGFPSKGGKLLASSQIGRIAPPDDLQPKRVDIVMKFQLPSEQGNFYISLDPSYEITEITERNNLVVYEGGKLVSPVEIEWKRLPHVRPWLRIE